MNKNNNYIKKNIIITLIIVFILLCNYIFLDFYFSEDGEILTKSFPVIEEYDDPELAKKNEDQNITINDIEKID